MKPYKACTKKEFAHRAEVSQKTLAKWLKETPNDQPNKADKYLTPKTVQTLAEKYVVVADEN